MSKPRKDDLGGAPFAEAIDNLSKDLGKEVNRVMTDNDKKIDLSAPFRNPEIMKEMKNWDNMPASKAVKKPDMVNHPPHYNQYENIEIIDLTSQMNFNRGNAVKYISRAGFKGGAEQEIEDLEKAVFYIQHEIKRMKSKTERTVVLHTNASVSLEQAEKYRQAYLSALAKNEYDMAIMPDGSIVTREHYDAWVDEQIKKSDPLMPGYGSCGQPTRKRGMYEQVLTCGCVINEAADWHIAQMTGENPQIFKIRVAETEAYNKEKDVNR